MNITEFVDRFTTVVEEKDGWVVNCPAHADSHASLRVTVGRTNKIMLKCRAGCSTDNVLKEMGLGYDDLADAGDKPQFTATSTDDDPPIGEIAAMAQMLDGWAEELTGDDEFNMPLPRASDALEYAEDRFGITEEMARRLGLGVVPDLGGGDRLVVPFRDERGRSLGYQARALNKNAAVRWMGPKSPSSGSWAKVGYFAGGNGWNEVVITEGPGDALTTCAVGYDSIGIRGAGLASNTKVQDDIVRMVGSRVAVLAGDNDAAGKEFNKTLADALSARGLVVKILKIKDGMDDVTKWRESSPASFAGDFIAAVQSADDATAFNVVAALSWDEDAYPLTDLGMARYLRDYIAGQGSGVRYSPEAGFFLLDRGVWEVDHLEAVRSFAQSVAVRFRIVAMGLKARAEAMSDNDAAKPAAMATARRYVAKSNYVQSSRGIDAMVKEITALPGVATDVNGFDQHPDLLAVRNGVIDLRDGTLRAHDAGLLLTRRVDLDYDPSAVAPRWEQFMREVFVNHVDLVDYMRVLVGYGITGHTDEQCFVVHFGTGANGKSVFTDALSFVFDAVTETTPFATFEQKPAGGIPNDLAALKGARIVMASEGEQGRYMSESTLKRLTGNDLVTARFMRREFFSFRPTFLIHLATNHKPRFKGQDEGLWRRVKLIPWDRYFKPEERDHYLTRNLRTEAQGILAWAVRGAVEWYADGLKDPKTITAATENYRETSDALFGFFPGWFERTGDDKDTVIASEVFKAYEDWADEERLPRNERWQRNTFYGAMEERGLKRKKTMHGMTMFGLVKIDRAAPTFEAHVGTSKAPNLNDV